MNADRHSVRLEILRTFDILAEEERARLKPILTNFTVKPSADGRGFSVWCEGHDSISSVDWRSRDLQERDALIAYLADMDFIPELVRAPYQSSAMILPVKCLSFCSDYVLEITFELGTAKLRFRDRDIYDGHERGMEFKWIYRDGHNSKWSDVTAFTCIREIAVLAKANVPIHELFAAIRIPFGVREGEVSTYPTYQSIRERFSGRKKIALEQKPVGTSVELAGYQDEEGALAQMNRLRAGVANLGTYYDGSEVVIDGDVIDDLTRWDFRTAKEKLRDSTIGFLVSRGYRAFSTTEIFRPHAQTIDVELSLPNKPPSLLVTDKSIGFTHEHPSTGKLVWYFYLIEESGVDIASAYSLLMAFANLKLLGEPVTEIIRALGKPSFPKQRGETDYEHDGFFEGGTVDIGGGDYWGDGLWMTSNGPRDLGR